MPRFKRFSFYQNKPKIKFFCKKFKNFRVLGAPSPYPQWSFQNFKTVSPALANICLRALYETCVATVLLILPNNRILEWKFIQLAKKQPLSKVMKYVVPSSLEHNLLQPAIDYKGWHYKIPPRVSPSFAMPQRIAVK